MDRSWMYDKLYPGRSGIKDAFYKGVNDFIEFAVSHSSGSEIRCPCRICANGVYHTTETVKEHLLRKGFTKNYHRWICHGESRVSESNPALTSTTSQGLANFPMRQGYSLLNPQQRMIFDAAGPNFVPNFSSADNASTAQCQSPDITSTSNLHEASPDIQNDMNTSMDEHISASKKFQDALKAASQPLWEGCEDETLLSSVTELLSIKSEFNLSENCYNRISAWIEKRLPRDHVFPSDYYKAKKLVRELGLPLEKIDICPDGCMLYWKNDIGLRRCKFCNKDRYKRTSGGKDVPYKQLRYLPLIPRLQRLYASNATAEHMRWHARNEAKDGTMSHPSDSEEWKRFDRTFPDFASESRNVRLALSADGFNPFAQTGKAYSCWPIIVTPYNLPPSMCLKTPHMFLTMIVPGPRNPKKLIDVCLQPLIEELQLLWTQGVPTFDISRNETFMMRASLLWTINDFPAYAMMSGWSTAGRLACPICMEETDSFWLHYSNKHSWFDCTRSFIKHDHQFRKNKTAFYKGRVLTSSAHERLSGYDVWNRVKDVQSVIEDPCAKKRHEGYGKTHNWTKQSIFWQLPYWKTLLIRHNLDVMHIEKNVFDNFFNTMMDISGKTKDTLNARKDMKDICHRPTLAIDADYKGPKPKAIYTVERNQKNEIFEWISALKFPDGYASNLGRCVQSDEGKLIGMKSHDCHVFMQRLLPIAFREMLPESVWGPITELSQFFHSLCATTLSVTQMQGLENLIPIILCKLERIFPPALFDSMEHLVVHLAYEARVGGPVQYRWMYPFERFLYYLKHKVGERVGNKRHVEASICNSYIIEEISTFSKHYFEPKTTSRRKQPRHLNEGPSQIYTPISVFNHPGQGIGKSTKRWIIDDEKQKLAMETYILLNCREVDSYQEKFSIAFSGADDKLFQQKFASWFKSYVDTHKVQDEVISSLSWGPRAIAKSWSAYSVNGYTFHTLQRGEGKSTMNSGIWVTGSTSANEEFDYYGLLEDIIELEYPAGNLPKTVVLFKCRWFDPINGIQVHKKYGLVDINHKKFYKPDDPYIFAQQAKQVYYTPYPGAKRDRGNWWAVCKTKPRGIIEDMWTKTQEPYQPEQIQVPIVDDITTDDLRDPSGAMVLGDDASTIHIDEDEGVAEIMTYLSSDEEDGTNIQNYEEDDYEEEDDY